MTDRFRTHFEKNQANVSQSVLLELMTILGQYRNSLYLVGGWVPYYLLKQFQNPEDPFRHVGSIDIDLVVDFQKVSEREYAGIVELLLARGYKARRNHAGQEVPSSFERVIKDLTIAIDFLAGEYGGTSQSHRHQATRDLLARKARGADLLPDHHLVMTLDGYLPDGAQCQCDVRLADIVSILSMKGITISDRYKEKDAYDIYALIAHYKNGAGSCLQEIRPFLKKGLVREGMEGIGKVFTVSDAAGPVWAAKFMEPNDPAAARIKQTEVYQQVIPFVEKIAVSF